MTSVIGIIIGMALLLISLIIRYSGDASDIGTTAIAISGWIGSILVIAGTGKLLFVDD